MAKDNKTETVPIYQKALLTITETAELTNIGQQRLRTLIDNNPRCDFIIRVGTKQLIKRETFLKFLETRKVL